MRLKYSLSSGLIIVSKLYIQRIHPILIKFNTPEDIQNPLDFKNNSPIKAVIIIKLKSIVSFIEES